MNKLAVATGIVLLGAGGAYAGPCDTAPVINDAISSTLIFNDLIVDFVTPSMTCTFSSVAPDSSPDSFVLYSADLRGSSNQDDDIRLSIERNGGTYVSNKTGPVGGGNFDYDGDIVGKEADGTIRGTATLRLLTSDGASQATLDSIDYTEFARTSRNEVNLSLNQVNLAAAGVITHLDGMSNLLTGGNLATEGGDEVGTFGALGSYNFGVQGRYNLADGFSLLGGVSIFDFASTNVTTRGFGGSFAVRYVDPTPSDMRLVAEGGVDLNSLSAVSFTRSYTYNNGSPQSATATGVGTGGVAAIYGKAGALWSFDDANEVVLSATIKQSALGIATYNEAFDPVTNPFPANLSGTTTMFTTAKTNADWTTELTEDLDLTTSVGVGATFANGGTTANVLGGGAATGSVQSTIFAEYGLNLGYKPMDNVAINAFAHGTTGTDIGTHLQVGAGARMQF